MGQPLSDAALAADFAGKTVLVTGGGGYLGSALVALLHRFDCHIVRLSRHGGTGQETAAWRVRELRGDIADPAIWEQSLGGVDFVFHLAAQTSTYIANADPVADQAVNVAPMLYLLEGCRRQGVSPTVCFASTVTVAGLPQRLPVDETHPDHPLTIYDLHKQMAEQYLRWYAEQGLVRGVTLRLANVYGPGPHSGSADRGILNQMIRRALAGEPLTVYGGGEQLRDYVYVDDVTRAFVAAAGEAERLNGQHFVIGSGEGHSIAQAMEMIAEGAAARTGQAVPVLHVEPPAALSPIEGRNFIADPRRFGQATGWRPHYSLAQGIERTMEAFLCKS
ncbi:MAG: NAD-dependent epimerase/dehydratase family protein [Desulfuromonadales bacterium]|nr:NAD-dependent epimerase/dehydratase family protein [Desulfuromonadales bacterium]